ncbi:MAG: hypothetical protein ACREQ5_26495 [Candidatus Dormibacteria bacterium]
MKRLRVGRLYYSEDPKFKFFRTLPKKCSCKLFVDSEIAEIFVEQGKACRIYRPSKNKPLIEDDMDYIDVTQIVMPITRSKTPRVDLIAAADIERAFIDGQQRYINLIESVHDMIMEERAKLIVPFRPDPFEGRALFPFALDERTQGGRG